MLATAEQQPKRGGYRKYMAHMNGAREQGQEMVLNNNKSVSAKPLLRVLGVMLRKYFIDMALSGLSSTSQLANIKATFNIHILVCYYNII